MPTPPEGAQRSDDGHYWWDESAGAWQTVDDTPAAGSGAAAPAAGSTASAAGSTASADPAAGGNEWPPAGYPADPAEWTQEQLQYWFGNTQDASEDHALGGDMVNVVAIADLEGNSNEGTA
jgi:hypothetical protein